MDKVVYFGGIDGFVEFPREWNPDWLGSYKGYAMDEVIKAALNWRPRN